jgi:hypothetical protein
MPLSDPFTDKSILPFPGDMSDGKVLLGSDVVQAGAMAGSIATADQSICIHAVRDWAADVCGSPVHGASVAHDCGQTGGQVPDGADEAEDVSVS